MGVPVSICTDNTLMSGVKLSSELKLVADTFDLTLNELVEMLYHGFSAAFVNPLRRDVLREEALMNLLELLRGLVTEGSLENEHLEEVFVKLSSLEGGYEIVKKFKESEASYIKNQKILNISADVIQSLPKADLHCRLIGSVPLDVMWKEVELLEENTDEYNIFCTSLEDTALVEVSSYHSFASLLFPERRTNRGYERAKNICAALLRSPAQIKRGVAAVLQRAIDDNIVYLELVVQPHFHTSSILSTFDSVITTINQAIEEELEVLKKTSNAIPIVHIVIASRINTDSLEVTRGLAAAAIRAKKTQPRVIGFGAYGGEISVAMFKNGYAEVFRSLQENFLRLYVSAGVKDPCSILPALTASANRLSCCYSLHKKPALIESLALHRNKIALEMTQSNNFMDYTSETKSFSENVIRFYLENGVSIAIVSINSLMSGTFTEARDSSLSKTIAKLVTDAGLTLEDLFKLLDCSIRSAKVESNVQEKLLQSLSKAFDSLYCEFHSKCIRA
ncbi:hypothetical protein GEMRC1_012259 [Eukaryota sp. GEM-RC1]